jgi:hypothetical protein
MRIKLPILSGLFALAAIVPAQVSTAAMLSPAVSQLPTVQKVGKYKPYNRCRYWANECATSWGSDNRGLRRCMWHRGC